MPVAQGSNRYQRGGRTQKGLPAELIAALDREPRARALFEELSEAHQREYVQWIRDGRRHDSRERRAAQTVMRLLASGQ